METIDQHLIDEADTLTCGCVSHPRLRQEDAERQPCDFES
jgi:hypothetical protein